jgi:hypothetical protein
MHGGSRESRIVSGGFLDERTSPPTLCVLQDVLISTHNGYMLKNMATLQRQQNMMEHVKHQIGTLLGCQMRSETTFGFVKRFNRDKCYIFHYIFLYI